MTTWKDSTGQRPSSRKFARTELLSGSQASGPGSLGSVVLLLQFCAKSLNPLSLQIGNNNLRVSRPQRIPLK